MIQGIRLRTMGIALILFSFVAAGLGSWMWFSSVRAWNDHLMQSYVAGVSLYETLRVGGLAPVGVMVDILEPVDANFAERGEFRQLKQIPTPSFLTNISIIGPGPDPLVGEVLKLRILSGELQYPISQLQLQEGQPVAQKLGSVTRLLATYCSDPLLFAQLEGGPWVRIEGRRVWGCEEAPLDLRLPAVLISLVVLAIGITLVLDISAHFDRFARALRTRRQLGGPESYVVQGPIELREIVEAVNTYLEQERALLSKRAMVLSGVSHDLGTPATRLRLRTALMQETSLRTKLEADIDSMTEMIEGVLTYTRAELNTEAPREISLTSLVEALVADYQDVGKPVELRRQLQPVVAGGRSLFTSKMGHGTVPDVNRVLIHARPVSLRRAISNLVENALKYGRRASLELIATAERVVIVVEDEGSHMTASQIDTVVGPFQRGENTLSIDGFGLGLSIVSTVADQHGGRLFFEDGKFGLRACIEISRT